jgi:hypothetical protein
MHFPQDVWLTQGSSKIADLDHNDDIQPVTPTVPYDSIFS